MNCSHKPTIQQDKRKQRYGVDELAADFSPYLKYGLVKEMIEKLKEKFSSPKHSGPADVVLFLQLIDDDEIEIMKRDVFEQVNQLIEKLTANL